MERVIASGQGSVVPVVAIIHNGALWVTVSIIQPTMTGGIKSATLLKMAAVVLRYKRVLKGAIKEKRDFIEWRFVAIVKLVYHIDVSFFLIVFLVLIGFL